MAAEFVGTAVLLFVSVAVVRLLNGPGTVLDVGVGPPELGNLLITGATSGAVITCVIISPIGAVTGGHVNPAVTIGMWALGSVPTRHVPAYLLGQFLGSGVGVVAARMLLGNAVARQVGFGAIAPPGLILVAVLAEGAALVLIMTVVVLTTDRMGRRSFAAVMGVVVAGLIVLTGPLAGGSFNPARQLWPYLLKGLEPELVIYIVAPVFAAVCAAWGWRRRRSRG